MPSSSLSSSSSSSSLSEPESSAPSSFTLSPSITEKTPLLFDLPSPTPHKPSGRPPHRRHRSGTHWILFALIALPPLCVILTTIADVVTTHDQSRSGYCSFTGHRDLEECTSSAWRWFLPVPHHHHYHYHQQNDDDGETQSSSIISTIRIWPSPPNPPHTNIGMQEVNSRVDEMAEGVLERASPPAPQSPYQLCRSDITYWWTWWWSEAVVRGILAAGGIVLGMALGARKWGYAALVVAVMVETAWMEMLVRRLCFEVGAAMAVGGSVE